jgi:hypothetical protein
MRSPRLPRPLLAAPAALLLTAAVLRAAPSSDLTLDEYRALAAEARTAASLKRVPNSFSTTLASRLRAVRTVTPPGGKPLPISLKTEADQFARLASSPGGGAKPPEGLADRLTALTDQLSVKTTPAPGNPNAEAAAILREKQFAIAKPRDPVTINTSFWEKVGKWFEKGLDAFFKSLEKFFRWLFRGRSAPNAPNINLRGAGDIVQFILIFLACVLATVGVYFLSRWGVREYQRRKGTLKDSLGGATGLDLTEEGITDPLSAAKDLAAQGEYRGAIRLVYIASLHRLANNGLIVLERNRTNWEYQRALRSASRDAYDALLPATRLFDRIWYGRMRGTAAEYEGLVRQYERLSTMGIASPAGANVPLDHVAASPQAGAVTEAAGGYLRSGSTNPASSASWTHNRVHRWPR